MHDHTFINKVQGSINSGVPLPYPPLFLIIPTGLKRAIINGKKYESTEGALCCEGRGYHFPSRVWDQDKISSLWPLTLFGYTCCIFWEGEGCSVALWQHVTPHWAPPPGMQATVHWGREVGDYLSCCWWLSVMDTFVQKGVMPWCWRHSILDTLALESLNQNPCLFQWYTHNEDT